MFFLVEGKVCTNSIEEVSTKRTIISKRADINIKTCIFLVLHVENVSMKSEILKTFFDFFLVQTRKIYYSLQSNKTNAKQ